MLPFGERRSGARQEASIMSVFGELGAVKGTGMRTGDTELPIAVSASLKVAADASKSSSAGMEKD